MKIDKSEVVKLIAELREKGYRNEDLAVMLARSTQTIWCWSSNTMPKRVPSKSDYEVLKRLADEKKA